MFDCTIIGGGIVGLATAYSLTRAQPGIKVLLLEKEEKLAQHQTGRNSGVIHSGIYYKPGSFKARFAKAGSHSMVDFCREHGLKHDVCGKVIVACDPTELPLLENLYQRGQQNGLNISRLTAEQVREIEPHVSCIAGLRVPTTGIVSYREVSKTLAKLFQEQGGTLETGVRVVELQSSDRAHYIGTTTGSYESRFLINCAGLHSDRVTRMGGTDPKMRIVPFRGEYYELVPEKRHLVKTLIYPVPNPEFPFLGVHFTKMIDGSVHAGPNAVLALKREGYFKTDFNIRDSIETLTYGAFWNLARRHWGEGWKEIHRSFSKAAFVRSLQRLIPAVQSDDLVPCAAGVRAQALGDDGKLIDDFHIIDGRNSLNVCNAPSPAATACLEIGKHIAEKVPHLSDFPEVLLR
ncbi:MAG TPA: L-2-hydroxyglutarate oxidase [Candidatus Kapabacteria bacterium]|nr:L-2-hydroxyglutarate oxidase [Candidatus Kapabacteria bacterium]